MLSGTGGAERMVMTVHLALKERYTGLLAQMGKLAAQYQRMCRVMDVPAAVKQLPPDDWRRYEEDGEGGGGLPDAGGEGGGGGGDGPDLDEPEDGLPHDFADSVRTHRERLIASYRNYRRYPQLALQPLLPVGLAV